MYRSNPFQKSGIIKSKDADPIKITWSEVCALRLQRHALSTPARDAGPAEIAAAICGAHAQILAAAELSIGLRVAGANRSHVREALWTEHSLVKTYGPRGTLHLLPAGDLAMWAGALSAVPPGPEAYPEGVRLSPEQIGEIVEGMAATLAETELTADELTDALAKRVGLWAVEPIEGGFQSVWPRWRLAIVHAANRGALCFGPNRGSKVTYTNPRRWIPGFRPANGQAALAGVVKRYLHAYGPATPQQFAQWLNVPRRWAAELFDSLSSELQPVEFDGSLAWLAVGGTRLPGTPPRGLQLLPYFDAYVVGSHPRDKVYPGRAAARALAGGQSGNYPVLLIDGVVAGIWHSRRSGKKLDITVEPLEELSIARRRQLDDQVARVGEILEGKPRLIIGTVTVGPHA